MRSNAMLATLRRGGVVVASFITIPDLFVAEVMGAAGADALVVDTEHSAISVHQLHGLLTALYPSPSTIIVRVATNDPVLIGQALDLGAEGVLVPGIRSVADAEAAVRAARYAPDGGRGFGPRRASRLHGDRADYLRRANDETVVVAMIESSDGVGAIRDIVRVPGLAAVFVGTADLAVSLGHLHDMGSTEVDAAAQRVADAAKSAGLPFGAFAGSEKAAALWMSRGAQIVTVGSDLQYIDAGIAQSRQIRERLAGSAPPGG